MIETLNNARSRSSIQAGQTEPGWQGQVTPPWVDRSSDRLGYDGAGRMTTKRYLDDGINSTSHAYNDPESVVGFTAAFDRAGNKFYERHLHAESRSHLYEPFDANDRPQGGYDSVDRLRQYQRGTLSSTGGNTNAGGGSVTTPISLPNTDKSRTYVLDGLGNWRRTAFDPVGGSDTTQVRQHNGLNQITRTTEGATTIDFEYDGTPGASNSNLENDGVRTYEWDAFNRLIKVYKTPATPVLIGEYTYDALGRRVRKVVTNGGLSGTVLNGTTDFIYHNGEAQCCEERDGANSATKQYLWGIYIDELMQMKTLTTINGNPAGDYYPLSDLLYRTTALTDSSATIVEAYDTDAYGNTLIFTAAGTGGDWWADDATQGDNGTCEFIFTGRRFDTESEIYFYRARYYNAKLGRFIGRDAIGYCGDWNLYTYLGSNPPSRLDATGEAWWNCNHAYWCCVGRTGMLEARFAACSGALIGSCIGVPVACAETLGAACWAAILAGGGGSIIACTMFIDYATDYWSDCQ